MFQSMLWWTIQQLKSKDAKTRLKAVQKLASMEDPLTLDHLLTALSDSAPEVRSLAVSTLGKLKDERAANPLVKALHDRDASVREAAAEALREIGDRRAMEPLVAALKDDNSSVRWRAASALDALGWSPSNETQKALQLVALGKLEKAAAFGTAAVEPLIYVLKAGVYYKRMQAVEALSTIPDPRIVKPLIDALRDEDSNVRTKTVEALASIGDARAVEPLISVLRDKDPRVRATAIEALSKLGDPRAIDALARLLKDDAWDVRMAAVEGLGKFRDARVIDHLVSCLRDKDRDTRLAAVISIGRIGDAAAIEALVICLTDEHDQVRQTCSTVLRRLNKNWEKTPEARRAAEALRKKMQSTDYWVRQAATEVLAKLGEVEAPQELEDKLSKFSDPMQARKQMTMEALLIALEDADRDLRQAGAEALGRLAEKRAASSLAKHLSDKDEWVRKASARALQNVSWEPTDKAELAHQYVLLEKWDEASKVGEAAIPALTEASVSRTSATRLRAVKALASINSPKISEALASRLMDDGDEIRHCAAQALARLGWVAKDKDQACRFAIETRDWETAATGGYRVIPLLMDIIKGKAENPDSWEGAASALAAIHDAAAVGMLCELATDADLASASLSALEGTISQLGKDIPEHDLAGVLQLPALVQNQYEYDAGTSTFRLAGFEPLDMSRLHQLAAHELERRKTYISAAG